MEELEKALSGRRIEYEGDFEASDGNESCQDMASHFLRIMAGSSEDKRILVCFLNYLRFFIRRKYEDPKYW